MNDLKNRIKKVIKLTDLADYLKISRPTLYKLIDSYDSEEYDKIEKKQLELFNYINDTPNLSKKQVVNFIVQNKIINMGEENNSISSFVGKYECTGSIGDEQEEAIRNIIISKNIGSLVDLINRFCFLTSKEDLNYSEQEELLFINYIKDLASKKEIIPEKIINDYKERKGGK
jgi:hypothetical protein